MNTPAEVDGSEARFYNGVLFRKLAIMAVVMFGFGFALVPFYKRLCEVTGINILTPRDAQAESQAKNTQIDLSRTISVEFDANSRGPWSFRPVKRSIDVHPGELVTVEYDITNDQDRAMVGQAIPSYAPLQAAAHFKKLECFCFQQQTLPAHETRRFPVVFFVDPKLSRDVHTITLSYTFFEIPQASASIASAPRVN